MCGGLISLEAHQTIPEVVMAHNLSALHQLWRWRNGIMTLRPTTATALRDLSERTRGTSVGREDVA